MSLALELYFHIPIAIAHIISAVTVIPLVTFGITTISRLQIWTQPLWLVLLIAPYIAVFIREPDSIMTVQTYFWIAGSGQGFNWLMFGSASTIAFSMVAQIGEQVDFLRFMPELTEKKPGTLVAGDHYRRSRMDFVRHGQTTGRGFAGSSGHSSRHSADSCA